MPPPPIEGSGINVVVPQKPKAVTQHSLVRVAYSSSCGATTSGAPVSLASSRASSSVSNSRSVS